MGRRGRNEGSIYRRQDRRWVGVVELGYKDGQRRRKYFYGRTRRDVAQRLNAAIRGQAEGVTPPGEHLTVGQFFDQWLTEVARPKLRPHAFASYQQIVERHLAPFFGQTRIARLTPGAIQEYMNGKIASGLSPYTVAVRWGRQNAGASCTATSQV